MRVAILIPAHDEAALLERNARLVWTWARDTFGPGSSVVISENGSHDATAAIARLLSQSRAGTHALSSPVPGKGGAVKRAAAAVEADVYLMLDADLSADLGTAARLVEAVAAGADLAVGSRRMPDSRAARPWFRKMATFGYAAAAESALGLGIRDLQCGCKAFSRGFRDAVLPTVRDDGWFFDTELLARARRAGSSIVEIGIRWSDATRGASGTLKLVPTGLDFLRKLKALRQELRD